MGLRPSNGSHPPLVLAGRRSRKEANMRTPLITAVSILFYVDAFLWLVGVGFALRYAFVHRALPGVGGARALSGPFESLGMEAFIVAGIVYMVVSALKIMVGYWLW